MSVWFSHRDIQVHGWPEHHTNDEPTVELDIATAKSWHDRIRLSTYGDDPYEGDEVFLSINQARQLIEALQVAIVHLESPR